jgi:hypothetical protein
MKFLIILMDVLAVAMGIAAASLFIYIIDEPLPDVPALIVEGLILVCIVITQIIKITLKDENPNW